MGEECVWQLGWVTFRYGVGQIGLSQVALTLQVQTWHRSRPHSFNVGLATSLRYTKMTEEATIVITSTKITSQAVQRLFEDLTCMLQQARRTWARW